MSILEIALIALTQVTNTENFAFFKLLGHKVLFMIRKDNGNC